MSFTELLHSVPTEVLVAICGAVSVIISSVGAYFVSKSTAKSEINKLLITWDHEDKNSEDIAFADMLTDLELYLDQQTEENCKKAIQSLNVVRTKVNGDFSKILDMLYYLITNKDFMEINLQQARMYLDEAVQKKREYGHQQTPGNH